MRSIGKAAGLMFLVTSCMVISLNPFFKESDLTMDNNLPGTWLDSESDSPVKFTFTETDEQAYELIIIDEEGDSARFEAFLFELDNRPFMDFFPRQMGTGNSDFYELHLIPGHSIYKYDRQNDKLKLVGLNHEWLSQNADSIKGVSFMEVQDRVVFTSDTEELQKFIIENADNENYFDEEKGWRLTKAKED